MAESRKTSKDKQGKGKGEPQPRLFFVAAIGFWLAGIPRLWLSDVGPARDTLILLSISSFVVCMLVAWSAAWVVRDVDRRGMHRAWAAGVLLLWIVFFPLYLILRATRPVREEP